MAFRLLLSTINHQPSTILLLSLLPVAGWAQTNFVTIFTNGAASNRYNIVFLSEGYTSNQLGQFLIDATNAANNLTSYQPYAEYSNYFNAYAIGVASRQSGCDRPPSQPTNLVDTYFNSTFEGTWLITIPPNYYDSNAANGQGKVDALLRTFLPGRSNLPVLLVNSGYDHGGSDGFDKTAIVAASSIQESMLAHETGHVVANLGDEYTEAYPGFPDTEEPNTTQETNYAKIKWKAWISTNTPIPTPVSYQDTVGLFEGAHYHTTGWYRPQLNCLMGSTIQTFCEVCQETMVVAFYRNVRPVDGFSPSAANVGISGAQPVTFSLSLLQPATHSLGVQWFTNGAAVSGATNASFTLLSSGLSNGTNVVKAVVSDGTWMVRNDPSNRLSQTVSWTLGQLRLEPVVLLPGGKFAFRVVGNVSGPVVVQGSTNLTSWVAQQTNTLVNGMFWYTNWGGRPQGYFRAKSG